MSDAWEPHLCSRLDAWRDDNLSRELKIVSGNGVHFEINGRKILSFASNDYLGLSAYPQVVAAAKAALDESGAGSRASPLITGHRREHSELERALAAFKQSETALVFPSGYQASVATLGALAGEEESIVLDKLAHASLLDGAKLSGARVRAFKHNDVQDLKKILAAEAAQPSPPAPLPQGERGEQRRRRCIVVIESLYSMDGDLAPLDEIFEVVEKAGALLLVDEAHATGMLGPRGRGALEEITSKHGGLPENVIALGTLSKALGSQGGYVCCSDLIAKTIVHAGRAYLFSTALAPAAAAAAQAALKLIDTEAERRAKVLRSSEMLRQRLSELKFSLILSSGPIIAVIAGEEKLAIEWSESLTRRGIYVPAIRFPTVKKGQARLRISVSADHSETDCETLLKGFGELKSKG